MSAQTRTGPARALDPAPPEASGRGRRRPSPGWLRGLSAAGLGAVLVAVSLIGSGEARPSRQPADVVSVAASVGATSVPDLQAHLQAQPRDGAAWAALGVALVEQARAFGDPSLYSLADDAFARSLDLRPTDNDAALAGQAALVAARHDFVGSLDLADRALEVNPDSPLALAVRTDALTELGRYDAALRAAERADERRPSPATFARLSYQRELRGDTAGAAELLARAAGEPGPAGQVGFLRVQLAELLRRSGDLAGARDLLDRAADADPADPAVLASQARLAVARGELADAATLWSRAVATAPLPEYAAEYVEVLLHLGRADEARRQQAVMAAVVALAEANRVAVDLETARYEADHGDPAVALAAASAERDRRSGVHVADAYAWALHASGRSREALPFARQALALGTRDPSFLYHLATIEAAVGDLAEARGHARQALAADPGWSPWQADRARDLLAQLDAGEATS